MAMSARLLARILVALPAELGAELLAEVDTPETVAEPPWLLRKRRLEARSEAIRAAGAFWPDEARTTVKAKELARLLGRYASAKWRDNATATGPLDQALRAILHLNGGRSPGWVTIYGALSEAVSEKT
jgi:hypothetical protein